MNRLLNHLEYFVCGLAAFSLLLAVPIAYGAVNGAENGSISGTVVETMNAGTYTYVQVDTGKEKIWAAAPQFTVKVGDKVSFSDGMPMENFESKTLKRTFKTVYFTGKIDVPGRVQPTAGTGPAQGSIPNDAAHASLHRPTAKTSPPAVVDFTGIKKPQGGLTIAEIYQQKSKLEKKQISFRGKVVKYNAQVMNKNWVHVQDGTGTAGSNDVTVTTDDLAKVGDTVLVKGTVSLNKDFGYGYKYDFVVENAKLSVEQPK